MTDSAVSVPGLSLPSRERLHRESQRGYLDISQLVWQSVNLGQVLFYLVGVHTAHHAPGKVLA